jgi:hypothetical protein
MENYIRPADKIITEQLMYHDENYIGDDDLEKAIQLSIQVAEEYLNKQNTQIEEMKKICLKIRRVAFFDNNVRKLFIILEPIARLFCENYCTFEKHIYDVETYNHICDMLLTIRLTDEERAFFKTLFVTL